MTEKNKYIHDDGIHNLKDPEVIVPVINDILRPNSVIDVGCGIGTFLYEFQKAGVPDILGLDGPWVKKEQLSKYIDPASFMEVDLEKKINLDTKFDLAVCLEVVEHLQENKADVIVDTLTSLSDTILFSAAIPGQGGQNHYNEQWPDYWITKFEKKGYTFHDLLRPIFWNHKGVSWWYKQNMYLVLKNDSPDIAEEFKAYFDPNNLCYVHPEAFKYKILEKEKYSDRQKKHLSDLKAGKGSFKLYIKMALRAFKRKLNF